MALQEQRAENNAAASRQLKLIERLRADKDALSAKCLAAASDLKAGFPYLFCTLLHCSWVLCSASGYRPPPQTCTSDASWRIRR